ncbi:MAG: cytochrome c biogenesis CcdA family protein [Halanaerobiales bacterium]|nr:cytochrome c biogenesis CcdA family protein [Halanaerobiales bacterium]
MGSSNSILIAFGAGLLSTFSPCVFPLIPSYLSILLGDFAEQKGKRPLIIPALIFVAGFSTIFIILGMSASYLGQLLLGNLVILRKISGIVVIILGVHLIGLIKIPALYREKKMEINQEKNKYLRPLLMGFALALAWTPCIGPILSSILIFAGNSGTIVRGAVLLTAYSAGFALPFLVIAFFFNRILPGFKKIKPYLATVQTITGVLIIILGILIFTNYIQVFSNF